MLELELLFAAPVAPLFPPPPRPCSVSSGESTLTRELSRQDLNGHAGNGNANGSSTNHGEGNGLGAFNRHSNGALRGMTGSGAPAHPGVQPGAEAGSGAQLLTKVRPLLSPQGHLASPFAAVACTCATPCTIQVAVCVEPYLPSYQPAFWCRLQSFGVALPTSHAPRQESASWHAHNCT